MSDTHNGQVLILPINNCAFSAGYKNAAYLKQQGYNHFGVDLYSNVGDKTVYACGDGEVVACGWDGVSGNERLGNVIAIIYHDVYLPNDLYHNNVKVYSKGDVVDLTCRMFHFDSISVEVGQKVTKDTVIGMYGNTGSTLVNGQRMGKHLHIEFDTDTDYPTLAYGVKIGGSVFNTWDEYRRAGSTLVDSTVNPSLVWSLDYNQSIKGIYSGWYTNTDINLPKYSDLITSSSGSATSKDVFSHGIDVSFAQGSNVDYTEVSKNIDFVFIRLGYTNYAGGINVDSQFYNHYNAATEAGLDIGIFVYSYDKSVDAAKKSALETIELIKDYPNITYPIAYDIEEDKIAEDLGVETTTQMADAFLSTMMDNKYYSILYTYTSYGKTRLDMSALSQYDVWISYTGTGVGEESKLQSLWPYDYTIWQYVTNQGTCPGVSGAVDNDYCYKDYPSVIKSLGYNNQSESTEDNDYKALLEKLDQLSKKLELVEQEKEIALAENEALWNLLRSTNDKLSEITDDIDNFNK